MNQHNKSLGKCSTNRPALSTGIIKKKQDAYIAAKEVSQLSGPVDVSSLRARLSELSELIALIKRDITNPFLRPSPGAKSFLRDAIAMYESVQKSMVGTPTYSENAVLQYEASNDIPTVPLSGLVPIERVAYIVKSATSGSTAGGFNTSLVPTDFGPWVSASSEGKYFRVKQVTSWTVPRADGGVQQGTFAGVAVPAQIGSVGTENLPIWSENFEPIGQGFAGIVTKFPLGAYPLYVTSDTSAICTHYTSLGGTGGITGLSVVFHVVIETLI